MNALHQLEDALNNIIVGKPEQVRLALVCLLSKGHLLLEDLPGSGKTTLAKALARLIGVDTRRIQFTADMLPADITGAMIYQPANQSFTLQKGPIFTNILLADEINRASPKCQSALLEAMDEKQVSIEGETLSLDDPFFVIATQNPTEQYGTYPLPESQLDRFLFKLSLGYMDAASEVSVLLGTDRQTTLSERSPAMSQSDFMSHQQVVSDVHASDSIAHYIQALLTATRESEAFIHGLSTRSGRAILKAAQAYAYIHDDPAVYPEHVQAVFPYAAVHRLVPKGAESASRHRLIQALIASVEVKL